MPAGKRLKAPVAWLPFGIVLQMLKCRTSTKAFRPQNNSPDRPKFLGGWTCTRSSFMLSLCELAARHTATRTRSHRKGFCISVESFLEESCSISTALVPVVMFAFRDSVRRSSCVVFVILGLLEMVGTLSPAKQLHHLCSFGG